MNGCRLKLACASKSEIKLGEFLFEQTRGRVTKTDIQATSFRTLYM